MPRAGIGLAVLGLGLAGPVACGAVVSRPGPIPVVGVGPREDVPPVDAGARRPSDPTRLLPALNVDGAPPGSVGRCRIGNDVDAGDPDSPAAIAHCPDPMEYTRGNGLGSGEKLPPVRQSVMPPWDLDALRDFACAYACAPFGSEAYLLAWNIVEDERPLRNENAAFAVKHVVTPPTWSIVVMYRHATNTWWNVDASFHSRARPILHGARPPTSAGLMRILEQNTWQFDEEVDGFRLLAGNVIDPLWIVVTSEPPPPRRPKVR